MTLMRRNWNASKFYELLVKKHMLKITQNYHIANAFLDINLEYLNIDNLI